MFDTAAFAPGRIANPTHDAAGAMQSAPILALASIPEKTMSLPNKTRFVVIGAGIHGLSTAFHLASRLRAKGRETEADIMVLDKKRVAAGASGIACGSSGTTISSRPCAS